MNSMKKLLVATLVVLGIAGCATGKENSSQTTSATAENKKLQVVTTNSIIYDMTKNIAGDLVDLHSIVPVGQDPHEYEPLPEDVQKVQKADLIFYNGINLENAEDAWFTKMVKNAGKVADKDYFAVSDGVEVIYLEGQNEAGKEDPHAWLNIENGVIYAKNIAKQLIAKDPKNKETYEKNLAAYVEKLEALDKDAKQRIAKIPEEKRLIVTSEGCFKYFSKAYDIKSAYIWEINTEEEGTPEQITKLVRQLRESKVPSLFVESSVDDRPMKTVSQETGLPIYSTIFTDSIAEAGKDGDSYYSMMKWNLDKIIEGLSK
mgnify:FL=1